MPVDPQASSPVLSNHSHWTPFADQPPTSCSRKNPRATRRWWFCQR